MQNRAIINAAKIAIKQIHMPKSLRGKINVIVNNDGIKVIKIKNEKK
jgi:hypothetical protein